MIILVLLCIHFVMSCIYFFKGLALFALYFVYYSIMIVAIVLCMLLRETVPFPGFLDEPIFNSVCIAFVLIITSVLKFPNKAKNYIIQIIQCDSIEDKDEFNHKPFIGDTLIDSPVNYETFIEYTHTLHQSDKAYSLSNASPIFRYTRIVMSCLMYVAGLIGLVIGMSSNDHAPSVLNSWVLWLITTSLVLLITSSVLLMYGLKRFFISLLSCATLGVVFYLLYKLLARMLQISIPFFVILLLSIGAFFILSFYKLFRFLTKDHNRILTYFDYDHTILGTNLALNDISPIFDYTKLVTIIIHFEEKDVPQIFEDFSDETAYFCKRKKIILAGITYDLDSRIFKLFLYHKTDIQLKQIDRFLKKYLIRPYERNLKEDPGFQIYKNILYPNIITLIKLKNEEIIDTLEEQQFDFTHQHPMIFTVLFEEKKNALSFCTLLESMSYDKVVYFDHSEEAKKLKLIKKYYHQVHIQKTLKISPEWLNIETLKLNHLANEHHGEYDFIQLGEIDEELYGGLTNSKELSDDGAV